MSPLRSEERAVALVVYGMVGFYSGNDSAAAAAFHDALEIRIDLKADGVILGDSALGQIWWRERPGVRTGADRFQAAVGMTRLGIEPRTYGLKVRCSTN